MKYEKTAKRLAYALNRKNMRAQDLVEAADVSKASVSQYINGTHQPSNLTAGRMGKVLDVNPLWLMGFDVMMTEPLYNDHPNGAVRIPVLGDIAAGIPLDAVEDIIDWEEIPAEMAKDGEYFGLRIKGDSMLPRMATGDVVIVKKQDTAENGDIAVVLVNGDSATVKKVLLSNGGMALIPLNPAFDMMTYTPEEVKRLPVVIIGVVVELRAKFK